MTTKKTEKLARAKKRAKTLAWARKVGAPPTTMLAASVCKPSEKACQPNSLSFTSAPSKKSVTTRTIEDGVATTRDASGRIVVMKRVRAAKKRARIMKEKYAVWEAFLALVSGNAPHLSNVLSSDPLDDTLARDLDELHLIAVRVAERAP